MRNNGEQRFGPYPNWLPRAIVSGFVATVAMAITFFLAYGLATVLAQVELNPRPATPTLQRWLAALTNNQVLDFASTSIYAAAVLHLVVGVAWAIVYGYMVEPRLPGTPVAKGAMFSLIPWVLSLVLFLPVVGGGFLGLAIGAGPFPAMGNLVLHLVYGVTLGAMYGPLGDVPADFLERDAPEVAGHYEQTAARGIVFGAAVGVLLGLLGAALTLRQPAETLLGVPPLAFVPLTMALGATLGGFWGSFGGLGAGASRSP